MVHSFNSSLIKKDMSEQRKVIIIGSGPAGYTAALYAARGQLQPLVFAGEKAGGQLINTGIVENFPGFQDGILGAGLMDQMRQQAEKFGADIRYQNVDRVDFSNPQLKKVFIKDGDQEQEFQAQAVILATGAESILLGIPGEDRLFGRGVATCAVCDAAFYKEKITAVVGGGDSAMEDTMALTKFAKTVYVIHRREAFRASKIMQQRVMENPKVKILFNTEVKEVKGQDKVEAIVTTSNGKTEELQLDGIFLAIGHRPMTEFLKGQVQIDEHGYIVTRQSATAAGLEQSQKALQDDLVQYPSMTSVEGVFAAGDVVDVRYKQAITAAGQGCAAAIDVERWLERNSSTTQ